jgi:hypothetical protein
MPAGGSRPREGNLRIRRRSLRKGLVGVGCLIGSVSFPQAAIGGGLVVVGSLLHFWSKACLEQNRRLTTAGPYRWTRNPFYLANLAIDLGLCFVIGNLWVFVLFPALWWVSYRDTIEREEGRLTALFPDEYPSYRLAVPRLVPNGRPLSSALVRGRFDLGNDALARGAEYARLLGIAIAPFAITAAELIRREKFVLLDGEHDGELALILLVPTLWLVKLALAEIFRRPETALVPWMRSLRLRLALTLVLAVATLVTVMQVIWLALLPGLWCVLLLLDIANDRRRREFSGGVGSGWRYSPAVVAGSLSASACAVALVR